ncbi:MAG: Fic family protein [Proteobacteria bacterium]|nr:Fic family protein [Pseudomonadota bacterium]
MKHLRNALELKLELDELRPILKEREAKIMQKFRLDWNYHSNHLEGNSLTFGETRMLILHGITAQGKPLKDHFEITGHDEAIKWVEEIVKGEFPLTENFIRQLHLLLLKEPYEVSAITPDGQPTRRKIEVGKYKSGSNHVLTKTGETFYFATPQETPAKMNDLLAWYRQEAESADVNPIILAAEFHYRFILIHPFDDGNGRVARVLMNFILMKFGFPPVIIKTEDKENYFSALRQADGGLIENFIEYIAKNLVRSLEIMIAGARGEEIEEVDDLDKKIALLKSEFKAEKNEAAIIKTKQAVLTICEDLVVRIYEKFTSSCRKFDEFYLKKESYILLDWALDWTRVDAQDLLKNVGDRLEKGRDLREITMTYEYEDFNRKGFADFNFRSHVELKFGLENYSLINAFTKTKIVKNYDQQISDEEISALMKIETERHFKAIEDKIRSEAK